MEAFRGFASEKDNTARGEQKPQRAPLGGILRDVIFIHVLLAFVWGELQVHVRAELGLVRWRVEHTSSWRIRNE